MPSRPETEAGILKGMYLLRTAEEATSSAPLATSGAEEGQNSPTGDSGEGESTPSMNKRASVKKAAKPVVAPQLRAQLFGSGTILNEVVKAQTMLLNYGVAADVWSVTSYQQLYRDAQETERHNLLHPGQAPKVPFLTQQLAQRGDVVVASSDYVKALPESIAQYVPYPIACLGTDGFGRSEGRAALRDFFEVDARYVTLAALTELAKIGKLGWEVVQKAMSEMGISADKLNPHIS
jgi:pyruvate dehydrogenase E1 component